MVGSVALGLSASAQAVVNPFTETFDSTASNWSVAAAPLTPPTYLATGGPDGSAFARTVVALDMATNGQQPLVFRGQSNFNSSANAFVGDWINKGVATLNVSLRHDGPGPVAFFARFAPAAGPGVVAVLSPSVQPNQWTTLSVAINPATMFIYEGTTFSAFTDISRVQFGFLVDASLAGRATPLQVDIDNVGIVPAPGTGATCIGACLIVCYRRRRTR